MRRFAIIGSGSLVLLLVGLAWGLSNFWIVFLFPAITAVIAQGVALFAKDGPAKDNFFVFSDFVYYIGIGAIVGLIGWFLPELENVLRYDAQKTYAQAVTELPNVSDAQEMAAASREKSYRVLEAIDAETVGSCLVEWQLRPVPEANDALPGSLRQYPPGCEMPLGVLDVATRDEADYRALTEQKSRLEAIVSEGSDPARLEEPLLSEETIRFLLYELLPSLLLCGVSLKVGKTTHALLKSPSGRRARTATATAEGAQ